MASFDHILNWELKAGSHKFPGPNGGTCVNEAAIVAAGFEYRKVASHRDCPPCFCPVLAAFAIAVNDHLPDKERNELLMPLVTRLAGSKGEPWVEEARANFLMWSIDEACAVKAMRGLSSMVVGSTGPEISKLELAKRSFTNSRQPDRHRSPEERAVGQIEDYMAGLAHMTQVLRSVGRVQWMPELELIDYDISAEISEFTFTPEFANATTLWNLAARQLTRAFDIGPRAPDADTARVVQRMEAAKRSAKKQKVDA